MEYSFENREGKTFLITSQKFKDKNMVFDLSSFSYGDKVIKTSYTNDDTTENYCWELIEENNKLYVIQNKNKKKELSITLFTMQMHNIATHNKSATQCNEIMSKISELFNEEFQEQLDNGYFLMSSQIVNGHVTVKSEGEVLGYASRFTYDNDKVLLCEYVGKPINRAMPLEAIARIGLHEIKFNAYSAVTSLYDLFTDSDSIGYLHHNSTCSYRVNKHNELLEINPHKLIVPYTLSSESVMKTYTTVLNTAEDIAKYKISIRPLQKPININKYILNEFLI